MVRENQALAIEDLNVTGLVKNRKLSRAISDAGWSKFKMMLAAKCDKYGRDLTIVDRWFASSQICSECGKSGGKKELNVREWTCLFCNAPHDRDICAAENLNRWAGGQSDQDKKRDNAVLGVSPMSDCRKNERGASVSLSTTAVCVEPLTNPIQLTLF